jgi:hypothetical protein
MDEIEQILQEFDHFLESLKEYKKNHAKIQKFNI